MIGGAAPARDLRRFALCAAAMLVPAFVGWWLATDLVVAALRPLAAGLARLLLPVMGFAPTAHGWMVHTGMLVSAGKTVAGDEVAVFTVSIEDLRRLTFGWPLFLSLMLAPPRAPRLVLRLFAGSAVLTGVFAVSACGVVFCNLAVMVNHQGINLGQVPPAFRVAWPRYGEIAFFLAGFADYAAIYFVPLLAAPVLWLALNPPARARFLDFGRTGAARSATGLSGRMSGDR